MSKNAARNIFEWIIVIVVAVIAAMLIRMFVAEPFIIPSSSMEDTLMVEDRVIGEKVTFATRSPQYGDIVTFSDPEKPDTILIKRVIATAGQTVDLVNGHVIVDGTALDESAYTLDKPSDPILAHSPTLDADVTYPYTVPEGSIWVMGDNRTNSLDSRYFGAVPVTTVTTKALFIYWPLGSIRGL